MSLDDCIRMAMDNNHRRPASKYAVAMAEAQRRQALSGYWPQIGLKGGYLRFDEEPNFIFPTAPVGVPAQTVSVPPGSMTVTVPAGVIGPKPVRVPVTFPGQSISSPAQQIPIPEQDIKLMDEDSYFASLQGLWLVYDGGMRKGYRDATAGLVDIAREEARRTDLEIVDAVRRFYHGAVLTRQLVRLGHDTLARMDATLSLTEALYKGGGGKVMKTDYLDNKVMVESIRAMVALLEKNQIMAQAALAWTMGLTWEETVEPLDTEIPYAPFAGDLKRLVAESYRFNPDWARVEAGIRAAEGAARTANSGHYPKIALTGDLHRWWNGYDAGMATENNKEGWIVGVGMELPLFSGFMVRGKVAEARARVSKIREEQFLLQEGLGLQIRDVFTGLVAAQTACDATREAMNAAVENSDLNTRAYQSEMVETEKVIRAQLIEALMTAQYRKNLYDHAVLVSQLDLLVGTEVARRLEAP